MKSNLREYLRTSLPCLAILVMLTICSVVQCEASGKYQRSDQRPKPTSSRQAIIADEGSTSGDRFAPVTGKEETATIDVGKQASFFDHNLTIELKSVFRNSAKDPYRLSAVISSPGSQAMQLKRAGKGFVIQYKGNVDYEIHVLGVSESTAQFRVVKK